MTISKLKILIPLFLLIFAVSSCVAEQNEAAETQENPGGIPSVKGDTVTTASGLKYIDAAEGKGEVSTVGDKVLVHYTGWLTDGTKFDSSKDRNQPFTVQIGQRRVIQGWEEGLQGMKPGGRRILIIPPDLGYGERAMGPIPSNATLIFEVELLDITKPRQPPEYDEADVQETGSGLKYVVLEEGEGEKAQKGQTAVVHYTGWLSNGTIFDSSVDRGQPFEFVIGAGRVIKGWDEAVAMMNVGDKHFLIIPPDLGYGARGAGGGVIPPNATLRFEVELLDLK